MFEIKNDGFYLNGEKFKIYSGVIHYFRVMPQYWEDRLSKLKLAGFNTVETYFAWNMHEPKKGEYCYEGMFDIVEFCKIAQKVGLYVIVRPGPYICAEWDFGGFPAWLLKDKNMQFRCNYQPYIEHVRDFFKSILPKLVALQEQNGGNILMVQVENEYGSYGNDKQYLAKIEEIIRECGIEAPLFTSDGDFCNMLSGGTLPHLYKALNFGSGATTAFNSLKGIQEDKPKMCMEFWCGWFDHWGEKHHTRGYKSILNELQGFIDNDASFNVYMFHGGTNFNFWAGSNYDKKFTPTTTSYDYCAFLNEYGEPTPTYHAVRELMLRNQNIEPQKLPLPAPLQNIGKIELTQEANLLDNLDVLGEKHYSAMPESMEYYGQNYGLIYYSTVLKGKYALSKLIVEGVHDIAYLYINGKLVKKYSRLKNHKCKCDDGFDYLLPGFDGECRIDILVEAMGRVNYGPKLVDRKGIQRVRIGRQVIFDWTVHTLPMNSLDNVEFAPISKGKTCPMILKGNFTTSSNADCFVEMKGFAKGFVLINGFNIGRYWNIGPQKTLYLPGVLLKEENEIIIVEQEKYCKDYVRITDKHLL